MARPCARHPENEAVAFCVQCGVAMCPLCEKPIEGRPYCQQCLDVLRREQLIQSIQKLQPTEETVTKVRRAVLLPLGNKEFRRCLALFVDAFASLVAAMPISLLLRPLTGVLMPVVGGLPFELCYLLSLLFCGSAYYIFAHWKWGETLGKHIFGLKVERTDGNPLNFFNSFWRLIGMLAVLIWAGVGIWLASKIFFWINFASEIQRNTGSTPLAGIALIKLIAVIVAAFLSIGVLITFVGKFKRGFHDIIAGSIVKNEGWEKTARKIAPQQPGRDSTAAE